MAVDPRKTFTINNTSCPTAGTAANNAAGRKKGFLDNITKFGGIEALNDIGGGKIGKGLRVLSGVSDSIRIGESVVPGREGTNIFNSTLGKIAGIGADNIDKGANAVLDTVGLSGAMDAVGNINIGATNRAYEAGAQVFERVKQGNFKLEDIPEVFSDFQNLETLARGIYPGLGGSEQQNKIKELCGATPYAMDLIAFAPKFKFMFIIEIHYSNIYQSLNDNAKNVAFVIKTSSRPKFNVDYEDINMYNFHTRVMRKVDYQPMEMSFYDDNKNSALKFYVSYMRAISPISNWKNIAPQDGQYEESGMDYQRPPSSATFTNTTPPTSGHSASAGPLLGPTTSLLREIKIHHVFDYGNKMNTYHFYNPRITSFNPSDLTMLESGDGCEFSFEFLYDGVYIDHMIDLTKEPTRLTSLTNGGIRPIIPVYDEGPKEGEGEPDAKQAEEDAPLYGFLSGGSVTGISSASSGTTTTLTSANSNVTSGITGAINQNIQASQKAIGGLGTTMSNAFRSEDTLANEAATINDIFS